MLLIYVSLYHVFIIYLLQCIIFISQCFYYWALCFYIIINHV